MKRLDPVARDMAKLKVKDPHDWTAYEREPIKIHHATYIVIQLLRGQNRLSDLWISEHFEVENDLLYRRAAKQFMLQLEGHSCPAFLMALRDQLNLEIRHWRDGRSRKKRRG